MIVWIYIYKNRFVLGHGGREVSLFVGNHFANEFLNNSNYLKGDIKTALEETYLKMDELILEKSGIAELLS